MSSAGRQDDVDLCIPRRPDGQCPAFAGMHKYEKIMTVSFAMLMVLGFLHVPVIGPMALCPAIGGTLGLVGVIRAIRGLLICANASSGCFAFVYLLVAFVSVPMMTSTCLHLDTNRQECYRCPASSRITSCPAKNTPDLGAYCYLRAEGSDCMADDCQVLAERTDKPCYCTPDYWGQTWDDACSDEQQEYIMPIILPMAVLAKAIFLAGTYAASQWGCCDPDVFAQNIRNEDERHVRDGADSGTGTVAVVPVAPRAVRSQRQAAQPTQTLQAVPAPLPKPIVVVQGVTVEAAMEADGGSPMAVASSLVAGSASSVYCRSCGSGLIAGCDFCPRCGQPVTQAAAAAAPPVMASNNVAIADSEQAIQSVQAMPFTPDGPALRIFAAEGPAAATLITDHSLSISSFESEPSSQHGRHEVTESYENPAAGAVSPTAAADIAADPSVTRRTVAITMDAATDDVEDVV